MKKWIAMLLALTMVVGFAACTPKADGEPAPEEEMEAPVEEETPAEDEVPAVDEFLGLDEPVTLPDEEFDNDDFVVSYMPEEKFAEMKGLMEQLVNGVNGEMMVDTIEITADMYEYYGIPATEGIHAVVSMPMMSAIAHEVVLVELPEGVDAADFAAQVETGMDPMKWVCVQPETSWVKTSGNYVVAVMSSTDMADAIAANFDTVFGA